MIRFDGVHKEYGSVHALRGVDITVNEGEFTVLIGPSGCGKTTALKMVNRLITPSRGRVFVGGKDVAELNAVELRRDIGYVIQETGLFPHMTIADNIALVPKLKKWPKAKRDERVDELLELVGLDPKEYRHRYPRHLSGGQRQRVGVARALAADPPIILMDEPFGATDPITRKQLQRELVRIKEQVRKTILFVTHDISEAFVLADSICLLREGKVVQHDTPEALVRRPADPFVTQFVGDEALFHEFEYLKVGELADRKAVTVTASTPAEQVIGAVLEESARAAFVVDEDGKLAGVITDEHIHQHIHNNGAAHGLRQSAPAPAPGEPVPAPSGPAPAPSQPAPAPRPSGAPLSAKDLAFTDPPIVHHGELVRDCFPRLIQANGKHNEKAPRRRKTPLLVVVDGKKRPLGFIAYEDLLRFVARLSNPAAVAEEREGRGA